MKKVVVLLLTSALFSSGCNHENAVRVEAAAPNSDPISVVGHGAILDAAGKEVVPTPEFVSRAQRYYIGQLLQRADERQRAELEQRRRQFPERKSLSAEELAAVDSALAEWLLGKVEHEDEAQLAAKIGALRNQLLLRSRSGIAQPILDALRRQPGVTPLSTTSGGAAYVAECRAAGVPIPPDWGDPAWTSQGMLSIKFIVTGSDAEVYVAESASPNGICIALPRSADGRTINALGIICLGRDTSKSCYWDNYKYGSGIFPIRKGENVPLDRFGGGAELFMGNGVCTDCHAGENPYVVHPGTPLDRGSAITAKDWVQPLVLPTWPQNVGPTSLLERVPLTMPPDRSCLNCHGRTAQEPLRRFPEISTELSGYCQIIFENAVTRTMPTGEVGNPAFKKHIDAIRDACKRRRRIVIVVGGGTGTKPGPGRDDGGGDLGCKGGTPDCPYGFYYWNAVRGPFWQTSPSGIPVESPSYRGSLLRIYVDGSRWKWRAFKDSGTDVVATPGGEIGKIAFKDISNVPDPTNCASEDFAVADPKGTIPADTVDATGFFKMSSNALTGFIGNIAQMNQAQTDKPDRLRVFESGGKVLLQQEHEVAPPLPLRIGPLAGESWTHGCSGWTPAYEAKDVYSTSDVQLVPAAAADDVFCYITGLTGAWSSAGPGGFPQPFAQIYRGGGGDLRLFVFPNVGSNRVGATASCIRTR